MSKGIKAYPVDTFELVTPHAQRERGKVIDRGVHIYIYMYIYIYIKDFHI